MIQPDCEEVRIESEEFKTDDYYYVYEFYGDEWLLDYSDDLTITDSTGSNNTFSGHVQIDQTVNGPFNITFSSDEREVETNVGFDLTWTCVNT